MEKDADFDLVKNCEFCGIKIEWDDDQCECTECIRKCDSCKRTLCTDCALPICGLENSDEDYTCKDHADRYELYDMRRMNERYEDIPPFKACQYLRNPENKVAYDFVKNLISVQKWYLRIPNVDLDEANELYRKANNELDFLLQVIYFGKVKILPESH